MAQKKKKAVGRKMNVLVLEEGDYYSPAGFAVCVARSQAAMLRWVKEERPNHKQVDRDFCLYFENDDGRTWLKCDLRHVYPVA